MLKQTVNMGDEVKLLKLNLKKQVARVLAGMVLEEFEELLMDAPQRSGNYVANMAIAAGEKVGRKGGTSYFPTPKDRADWYNRANNSGISNFAAIEKAREENKNVLRNVVNSVSRGSFIPSITIYNRLTYADKVEEMEKLRLENAGGEKAMSRAAARMEIRLNKYIDDNSPEWQYYVKRGNP